MRQYARLRRGQWSDVTGLPNNYGGKFPERFFGFKRLFAIHAEASADDDALPGELIELALTLPHFRQLGVTVGAFKLLQDPPLVGAASHGSELIPHS
jgi:hypothetical protein